MKYNLTITVRPETFFGDIIEKNNITSNECQFDIMEEFPDGTVKYSIKSDSQEVLNNIQSLCDGYDASIIPLTSEQKLEQVIQELMALRRTLEITAQDLGTQITDVDLGLLEHKVIDHV